MTYPLGALSKRWRGAFMMGGLSLLVSAGCGEDKPAPVGPSSGGSGLDAGGPVPDPSAAGGSGGFGSNASAAGASSSDAGLSSGAQCAAGTTEPCTFDRLCSGERTCGADGTFGSCVCDSSALLGGGVVGARCESDRDCAGGGTCLRADSNIYLGAGGPAGGYCSFSCTVQTEAPFGDDCAEHDSQSFCAPLGPNRATFCLRTCLSLDPDPGEGKCMNRSDLVCISRAAGGSEPFSGMRQEGYCAPQCGSNADCPPGRVCHAQAGICTDAQVPGAPIGARCSLDTDCSGLACENRDAMDQGVCTASCTLGSLSGCGFARDEASRGAACVTAQVGAGRFSEGVGDLGFCRELCDVAEDCEQFPQGWICAPLSPAAADFFGRSGACVRR